jgi:hypothetical protein
MTTKQERDRLSRFIHERVLGHCLHKVSWELLPGPEGYPDIVYRCSHCLASWPPRAQQVPDYTLDSNLGLLHPIELKAIKEKGSQAYLNALRSEIFKWEDRCTSEEFFAVLSTFVTAPALTRCYALERLYGGEG